ncbi:MAG: ribose-phosphate diphosphokinase [Proteobacteria bacterium]|nr:ribose-phosphate diphosphokinase [Pseudomonadota bacterium]
MKLLSGNSNRALSQAIADHLDAPLTKAQVKRFADNEVFAVIEENVRGEDVFILQSTSYPANDNLMELLIMTDALVRASARRITAVMPYFGYARQDRKTGGRTPISAKLVANLITRAGADRVLTMDLHAGQIQGFFDIPTDNLVATPVLAQDIKDNYPRGDDLMIVSPDVGGVVRARSLASRLNADLAIVDKRRPKAGESEVMNIIGDVEGRRCILFDDIVDSGGTLVNAAKALIDQCLTDWTENARDELRTLINDAFRVDAAGNIRTMEVLRLRRLEIDDERWQRAMTAIGEAVQIESSKSYVRIYERDDETGLYNPIALDLAVV